MKYLLKCSFLLLLVFNFSNLHAQLYPQGTIVVDAGEMELGIIPGLPLNAWTWDSDNNLQFCGLGLWMSGFEEVENGEDILFASYSKYNIGNTRYAPGPVIDLEDYTDEFLDQWDTLFTVDKTEIEVHILDFESDGIVDESIPDNVLYYPASGNPFFEEHYGFELPNRSKELLAPFIDRNNNGIYDPHLGDFPKIRGTKAIYYISNTVAHNWAPSKPFECHTMIYVDESGDCATTLEYDVKIYYSGEDQLVDFRVGVWMDNNNSNLSTNAECDEENYVGFLPSENLSFFYGKADTLCEEGSSTLEFGRMLYQSVENQTFNTSNQPSNCNFLDLLEDYSYHKLINGYHADGLPITYGGEGYNIGSTDTVKIMYHHEEVSGKDIWYDSDEELNCHKKSSLTGFGPFSLNKGDILDVNTVMYYFEADDWETPSKERIISQYDNIRGGCTDTLEWNDLVLETVDVLLYPNPTNDYVYLFVKENVQVELELVSPTGGVVQNYGLVDLYSSIPYKIDLSSLSPGTYFLRLTYSNSEVLVRTIVVL